MFKNPHFEEPEAVVQRCSVKKVFLEISQNSQEKHLCQGLFFNKVAGQRPEDVNFVKFVKTPFFTEHLWATASEEHRRTNTSSILSS